MSSGNWFHWSFILWKKLCFKTLVLAYFIFKVKKSLDLSEKHCYNENVGKNCCFPNDNFFYTWFESSMYFPSISIRNQLVSHSIHFLSNKLTFNSVLHMFKIWLCVLFWLWPDCFLLFQDVLEVKKNLSRVNGLISVIATLLVFNYFELAVIGINYSILCNHSTVSNYGTAK